MAISDPPAVSNIFCLSRAPHTHTHTHSWLLCQLCFSDIFNALSTSG